MKFILVFVALICLAHCGPSLESSFKEMTPDQDLNKLLQDNEAPFIQHHTTEQGTGKARTSAVYAYKTCIYCHLANPSQYGIHQYALCYQCSGSTVKNRLCYSCTHRSTSPYEITSFCYYCV